MRVRVLLNRWQTALVVVLFGAASSCGGDGTTGPLNNCADSAFVDRSAAGASRVVGFGGFGGSTTFGYAPACITIAAGQSVTFSGGTTANFGMHPLGPGRNGDPTAGSPGNPVPRMADGNVREITVNFPSAGTFPYICETHAAAGMAGVVRVR